MKDKGKVNHHGLKSIDDLRPAKYNPRTISTEAAAGLGSSLREFGDISGITWNKRTGNLVCGHQRVSQLRALGAQLLDGALQVASGERYEIRVVDWPESKEKAANIAANNPHIGGAFTPELGPLLDEVKLSVGDDAFSDLMLDKLINDVPRLPAPDIEEDEVPEPPKTPITKLGDVWTLGDHVLVCGDCRDVETARSADVMVTDPPYGVSYEGKTKDKLRIKNDDLGEAALSSLVLDAFDTAQKNSRAGAYWFATVPAGPLHILFAEDWKRRGILRQIMVWAKDSMVLGHSEYHYQHEPILFGWVPGGTRMKNPDRTRTTLWNFDRPKRSKDHPTMKPVALFAKMIVDGSASGGVVLDPFCGSGTSLIAAEETGRRCNAIELDPRFCDVIIERWENLTGGKAKRASA